METQCLTIQQALNYILCLSAKKTRDLLLKTVDLVVATKAQQEIHYSNQ